MAAKYAIGSINHYVCLSVNSITPTHFHGFALFILEYDGYFKLVSNVFTWIMLLVLTVNKTEEPLLKSLSARLWSDFFLSLPIRMDSYMKVVTLFYTGRNLHIWFQQLYRDMWPLHMLCRCIQLSNEAPRSSMRSQALSGTPRRTCNRNPLASMRLHVRYLDARPGHA